MTLREQHRVAAPLRQLIGLATALCASGCMGGRVGSTPPEPVNTDGWVVGSYQPGTHSHNDYERRRPLAEALEHGFASIEVDVALREGELYVTHDSADIDRSATLAGMYLDPLRKIAQEKGSVIYAPPAPPLQLLIDVKSDPGEAHEALDAVLGRYGDLVTRWTEGNSRRGAVTVVVSGNRARERIRSQTTRFVALDGRIWEDRESFPPSVMPLVSINWDDTAGPGNDGGATDRMSNARRFIEQVHSEGRQVRFWDTPDRPETWAWLKALGVDYVGTDDVRGLSGFMGEGREAVPMGTPKPRSRLAQSASRCHRSSRGCPGAKP